MSHTAISRKTYLALSAVLFTIYLVHGFIAIPRLSVTGDEGDHLNYAIRFVKGHPEKIKPFDDASTMPMSAINTIPRMFQQVLYPELRKADGGMSDIFSGRYLTLIVSMLTGFFILKWSTEIAGRIAGLFSLFLFTYCPNLNAHSVLVTTDAFSALFTIASAYFFWRCVRDFSFKNVFFFSLSLALAQLSKQSLTHLFFIYIVLTCFFAFKHHFPRSAIKATFLKMSFSVLVIIAVINIGFQFQQTGLPLKEYQFRSSFFTGLQKDFAFVTSIPLPFPKPYIQGLDLTKNIDEMGGGRPESSGNIYLLGEQRSGRGFWYYYFVVIFFKIPIPFLVFTLLALFIKQTRNEFVRNDLIPIFIIAYLLVYFNFFYHSQVGIRHIIMIFPLLYVLLGNLINEVKKRTLIFALMAYTMISFYYYFPNLIAYTNEFVLPKRNAYKIFADSNIDYSQSYFWLQDYMQKHPEVKPVPPLPQTGSFIIGINQYLDLSNQHKNDWIKSFKPVAQVQHSYLLFSVSQNDLTNKN